MQVYNISADTWYRSNATLNGTRSDLCMAAVNGTLYSAGKPLSLTRICMCNPL